LGIEALKRREAKKRAGKWRDARKWMSQKLAEGIAWRQAEKPALPDT